LEIKNFEDRVAREVILECERTGKLTKGGTVIEGTVGSTGISLALVANAKGYNCTICIPDDQSLEKVSFF